MTPTEIAALTEKQIALWRKNLGREPSRPVTANDLRSVLEMLSNLGDAVKALDAKSTDQPSSA